ncbi:MAG: hypothetical protein O3C40_32235 [Planctomycetota bacterium]|nr:hypothetical protein [Planctomycetota bacterium]
MNQQEAARAVLIEVVQILGAFKDDLVIVGGWVPDLMYPGKNHVGSLDVDLAVGPGAIGANAYSTILGRLKEKDYSHELGPTRFYRVVPGAAEPVKVDLISGEYAGDEKAAAIQVDELRLNTLHGIDLAFEVCQEITIEGNMPDGTQNTVRARIARPEAFVLIKAFALAERAKEKDAYDIAFILHNYEPSLAALAATLAPLVAHGLGAEAYQILSEKFATLESVGPSWAARVAEENGQDLQQAQQAAFQDAQDLFDEIRRIQE